MNYKYNCDEVNLISEFTTELFRVNTRKKSLNLLNIIDNNF